ncbi:MAG: DUF2235 domain-containing protein [FCB group bacterium]|nr:DUF2235 domain-containing protein [FCB group bacterium]
MAKNIVIFSDGTGQDGGEGYSTNVYKLFNMIENRTNNQIAFYDRGLGTGWRKISGNAFGVGISKNVRDCYQFLFENFQADDRVFLFGFSRGAFTVRSLSGFVDLIGILPKSRPELIKKAYKIYKMKDRTEKERKKKNDKLTQFKNAHHPMNCTIEFIGVWDTVRALGVPFKALEIINPFKNKFHNAKLCKNVLCGCHALSIDDERRVFHPTLWDEKNKDDRQEISQVWFAGVHTDVGGGYPEPGLSDITLKWMVAKAEAKKLLIYPKHEIVIDPNPNDKMHNPFKKWGRMYRRKVRNCDALTTKPVIHPSVLERDLDDKNKPGSKYKPWILSSEYDIEPQPVTAAAEKETVHE